jgi:hypothetical protein
MGESPSDATMPAHGGFDLGMWGRLRAGQCCTSGRTNSLNTLNSDDDDTLQN